MNTFRELAFSDLETIVETNTKGAHGWYQKPTDTNTLENAPLQYRNVQLKELFAVFSGVFSTIRILIYTIEPTLWFDKQNPESLFAADCIASP